MEANKNKLLKTFIVIFLIGCLLTVLIGYYMYNKPHRDVRSEKPVMISSVDLISAYQKNETEANQKFLDKAVQITGKIENIETNNDGFIVITMQGENPMAGVRCTLKDKISVQIGEVVTLKGRCTGFLSDVILIDCVLIK